MGDRAIVVFPAIKPLINAIEDESTRNLNPGVTSEGEGRFSLVKLMLLSAAA